LNSNTSGRLLLITPPQSYRLAAFLQAAKKLKCEVLVASSSKHSFISEVASGLHIDLENSAAALATILQAAKQTPFSAIIATEDQTVELAAQAAYTLGLAHNTPESAQISRRKDLSREILLKAGLPVPEFLLIDLRLNLAEQIQRVALPCVVKPLSLSASCGVIRANSKDELIKACKRTQAIIGNLKQPKLRNTLLIETYIPGLEIAIEGLMDKGQFQPIAIFDKPAPLEGPFFEESYYITPSRLDTEIQKHAIQRVEQACQAYGLKQGPIHAECRIHDGEAWILEVASRSIGGDCAQLIRFSNDQSPGSQNSSDQSRSLEEIIIAQALGRNISIETIQQSAGVLMIPIPKSGILRKIEGLEAAQEIQYIESVRIAVRPGNELITLPEGASYLGFMIARGPSPDLVETALRQAHECLNIVIGPLWKIHDKPTNKID
jgi:hypothetical protein